MSEPPSSSCHLETTCCVCGAANVPHKERRKVSWAHSYTDLGRRLNEISQISMKLPGNAIIIVCKRCSDLVAKVEKLKTELDATRGRIMQLVDQYAQHLQRRKRTLSPSFKGTGISPASKKIAPRPASSAARALFPPIMEDLSRETENMHLAVPLELTSGGMYFHDIGTYINFKLAVHSVCLGDGNI